MKLGNGCLSGLPENPVTHPAEIQAREVGAPSLNHQSHLMGT